MNLQDVMNGIKNLPSDIKDGLIAALINSSLAFKNTEQNSLNYSNRLDLDNPSHIAISNEAVPIIKQLMEGRKTKETEAYKEHYYKILELAEKKSKYLKSNGKIRMVDKETGEEYFIDDISFETDFNEKARIDESINKQNKSKELNTNNLVLEYSVTRKDVYQAQIIDFNNPLDSYNKKSTISNIRFINTIPDKIVNAIETARIYTLNKNLKELHLSFHGEFLEEYFNDVSIIEIDHQTLRTIDTHRYSIVNIDEIVTFKSTNSDLVKLIVKEI